MIISASRRTDIPAFYAEWFMNRIRAGFCKVPNPLNLKQVATVSLHREDVDAIVFWSKNPAPLLPHLGELDRRGLNHYFQFTLNNYPRALEPNVPSFDMRIEVFKELSQRVGCSRVVWRYDPIVISNFTASGFHIENFSLIAQQLEGLTQRVMISIVDFYRKTDRRLSVLEKEEGYIFERNIVHSGETVILLKGLAQIAKTHKMEIYTCAEDRDYSQIGVPPGKCIDDMIVTQIQGKDVVYRKDPYQREACLCMVSKDIGSNDTCMHGCQYCYSTTNYDLAQRRFGEHDPLAPALWGKVTDEVKAQEENRQMPLFRHNQ